MCLPPRPALDAGWYNCLYLPGPPWMPVVYLSLPPGPALDAGWYTCLYLPGPPRCRLVYLSLPPGPALDTGWYTCLYLPGPPRCRVVYLSLPPGSTPNAGWYTCLYLPGPPSVPGGILVFTSRARPRCRVVYLSLQPGDLALNLMDCHPRAWRLGGVLHPRLPWGDRDIGVGDSLHRGVALTRGAPQRNYSPDYEYRISPPLIGKSGWSSLRAAIRGEGGSAFFFKIYINKIRPKW